MKIDRRIHQQIRLQNLIFTLLFLVLVGLSAWLSTHFFKQWDWTASGRHTLAEASRQVLKTLDQPLKITAFAREDNQIRQPIQDLIGRYQQFKPDLTLEFVNPDLHPDQVRELGISVEGELRIQYGNRSETLQNLDEQSLTNALLRLAQTRDSQILFVEGHGERSPLGEANFDLGQFGNELQAKGFHVNRWSLAKNPQIPANTALLVIASPRTNYLAAEVVKIKNYVEQGGKLLWLMEPEQLAGLEQLAIYLGIQPLPGTVIDSAGQMLGIQDPTFALVAEYPAHAITRGLQTLTLFPKAAALGALPDSPFQSQGFLITLPGSWTETGTLQGAVAYTPDSGEREGPLNLGLALTRELPAAHQEQAATAPQQQRVVVIGDGDFLANTYLGNGGNLDLGLRIIRWLTNNDALLEIPAKTTPDAQLQLSSQALAVIGIGFLIALPISLLGCGFFIWWQRRNR